MTTATVLVTITRAALRTVGELCRNRLVSRSTNRFAGRLVFRVCGGSATAGLGGRFSRSRRGPRRRLEAPPLEELVDLGRRHDRQPRGEADEPLAQAQALRVEDALAEPELDGRDDRDHREPGHLEEAGVRERLVVEDRAQLVLRREREEQVRDREDR